MEEKGWELKLKKGDKVIGETFDFVNYEYVPYCVLVVDKVTPSGIIITNDGSFKQSKEKIDSCVELYGNSYNVLSCRIVKYCEEKYATVLKLRKQMEEERDRQYRMSKAKRICNDISTGYLIPTDEQINNILEIFGGL